MTTSLILPDLHHKVDQATKIIKRIGTDKVICVGDVFDDFDDTPEIVTHSAEWYVEFVNNPNNIMLMGNHEGGYRYPYRTFQCSGYSQWKYFLINDIVDRKTWDKVKWYHFLDNRWLITHAGLHRNNVPGSILKLSTNRNIFIKEISEYLDHEISQGFQDGANGKSSWIFNAGRARGGNQPVGGITWCDFNTEFIPIKGISQIFGHTAQRLGFPKWCRIASDGRVYRHPYDLFTPLPELLDSSEMSINLNLDVFDSMYYAIWDGEKLDIRKYSDL